MATDTLDCVHPLTKKGQGFLWHVKPCQLLMLIKSDKHLFRFVLSFWSVRTAQHRRRLEPMWEGRKEGPSTSHSVFCRRVVKHRKRAAEIGQCLRHSSFEQHNHRTVYSATDGSASLCYVTKQNSIFCLFKKNSAAILIKSFVSSIFNALVCLHKRDSAFLSVEQVR